MPLTIYHYYDMIQLNSCTITIQLLILPAYGSGVYFSTKMGVFQKLQQFANNGKNLLVKRGNFPKVKSPILYKVTVQ